MEEQIDGDGNAAAIKRELAGRVCADVTANKRINNLGGEKRAAGSENPVEPGLSSNFLAKSLAHASTNRRKTEKWKAYEAKMERAFILLNEVAEIVNTVESQIEEGRKEEVEDEVADVVARVAQIIRPELHNLARAKVLANMRRSQETP